MYHVLNRSAGRVRLYRTDRDYEAFQSILEETRHEIPIRLLGWCLMPNHWHLVLWPSVNQAGLLSQFMRQLTVTHATRWRWHRRNVGEGPVYQGRFKAFAVADDLHYLTLLRYVETNAWRAGLCKGGRAESWPWSSLHHLNMTGEAAIQVNPGPLDRPAHWLRTVNSPMNRKELEMVQHSIQRDLPMGSAAWSAQTAKALNIPYPPRARGRPRKQPAASIPEK